MLEPLANLHFDRCFSFIKVCADTFDYQMVSFARLVSIFHLEIAILGAQRVKGAAARLLRGILQIANSAEAQHRTCIHFLRLDARAPDVMDHNDARHDYHTKDEEKPKRRTITREGTQSCNCARSVIPRFSRYKFSLLVHAI